MFSFKTPGNTEKFVEALAGRTWDGKGVALHGNEMAKTFYKIRETDFSKRITKQIIDRVKSELGDKVGIYHSRFNDHERVEIYQKVFKREYDVVIGVRSAIFLPFEDLGLIVVDEEHDGSFKQYEPAPRYQARDYRRV